VKVICEDKVDYFQWHGAVWWNVCYRSISHH